MTTKCNRTKTCDRPVLPGRKWCQYHADLQAAATSRFRERDWEAHLASQRRKAHKYHKSDAPQAVAYRQRSRAVNRRSVRAWNARNADRKLLISRLAAAIKAGAITKPSLCQDCLDASKQPVVAYGLAGTPGTREVSVERWCCWGCWWRRSRRDEGRPE